MARPRGNPFINDLRQKLKQYLYTDPNNGQVYQVYGKNKAEIQEALLYRGIISKAYSRVMFERHFKHTKFEKIIKNSNTIIHYKYTLQNLLDDGYEF